MKEISQSDWLRIIGCLITAIIALLFMLIAGCCTPREGSGIEFFDPDGYYYLQNDTSSTDSTSVLDYIKNK